MKQSTAGSRNMKDFLIKIKDGYIFSIKFYFNNHLSKNCFILSIGCSDGKL